MKSLTTLIWKGILLIAIVWVCCNILRWSMGMPFGWTNNFFHAKAELFEQAKGEYNTVFLGNSRFHRGVDPSVYDATMSRLLPEQKTKSFNYAVASAPAGEVYNLFNRLLDEQRSLQLKDIIIQLPSIKTAVGRQFQKTNLHKPRNVEWCDFSSYLFAMRSAWGLKGSKYSFRNKWKYSFNYTVALIENWFAIGMIKDMVLNKAEGLDLSKGGPNQDGYFPLALDDRKVIKSKHRAFLRNNKTAAKRANLSRRFFTKASPEEMKPHLNSSYLAYLVGMIDRAKSEGIQLTFIVPPCMNEFSYNELAAIYHALPKEHVLELTNADNYPFLYDPENMWDPGHLNTEGGRIFSEVLAYRIAEQKSNKNLLSEEKLLAYGTPKSNSKQKGKQSKADTVSKKEKKALANYLKNARAFKNKGNCLKASKFAEKALEVSPDNFKATFLTASCAQLMNKMDKATEFAELALERANTKEQRTKADAFIKSLN